MIVFATKHAERKFWLRATLHMSNKYEQMCMDTPSNGRPCPICCRMTMFQFWIENRLLELSK